MNSAGTFITVVSVAGEGDREMGVTFTSVILCFFAVGEGDREIGVDGTVGGLDEVTVVPEASAR